MPTSFLELPQELRDQIYDALWTATPKISLVNNPSMGRIVACYKSIITPETALPTWLLTNKQVLHEATQQMIRYGTWIIRVRSEYDERRVGSVLSPTLARRLIVTLTQPLEGPRPRWPHVVQEPILRPSKENIECLSRAIAQVSSTNNARDIRLVLEMVREEPDARIDLSALEVASCMKPGLQKLEFVIMREQIYRAWSEGFVEAMGAEIKRVGNKVMGSDEDPSVSDYFQDRGVQYTFEKPGEMELCRVDSAVGQ